MQVVRQGNRLFEVKHRVQMGDDVILKTSALITMNVGWNPIGIKPFVDYKLCDGKCLLVGDNEGLTELGEGSSQH